MGAFWIRLGVGLLVGTVLGVGVLVGLLCLWQS